MKKEKSAYFTEKYVRYRREEKVVAEQWLIRIHRMIPAEQIMGEKPLEIKVNLNFELWFGETNNDQDWVIFGLLFYFYHTRHSISNFSYSRTFSNFPTKNQSSFSISLKPF